MTDQPEVQASPVVKVARDLTEIVKLTEDIATEAEHKANDSLMPGGLAMVALAGVANLEAWENRYQAAESLGRNAAHVLDEDDTWEPPLQTLCFWSEQWRAEHGSEYDQRPTLASEANFIRWALDWAWDHELHWDDFAADIRKARVRLENLLHAGSRPERSRIICNMCDSRPRLLVVRGVADDCSDDGWKCPGCKARFDAKAVQTAHATMLRSEGAERWVAQADAIATLKAQGRPERTVRAWLAEGEGSGYCDPTTHQVWVWWPDLWRKHLTAATRNRAS
jgi:hypothetical protein